MLPKRMISVDWNDSGGRRRKTYAADIEVHALQLCILFIRDGKQTSGPDSGIFDCHAVAIMSISPVLSCSSCLLISLEGVRGKEQKRGACVDGPSSSVQDVCATPVSHRLIDSPVL